MGIKPILVKVGENEQGNVVTGAFKIMDTVGLPLDIIRDMLHDEGMTIAWDYFISDARKAGWQDKTIANKMRSVDVPEYLIIASLRGPH